MKLVYCTMPKPASSIIDANSCCGGNLRMLSTRYCVFTHTCTHASNEKGRGNHQVKRTRWTEAHDHTHAQPRSRWVVRATHTWYESRSLAIAWPIAGMTANE